MPLISPKIRELAEDPKWRRVALMDGEAELMRRSFRAFVREAWHLVEPARAFIPGWHADAVADHLEAVARKQIRFLLIEIPPGHAKSLLLSVLWPAWVWTWNQAYRSLFASYAEALAVRDSVRCRTLIESDWYQERFVIDPWEPEFKRFRLRDDQNAKDFFENTASGFRISLGVGGKGTGYRGDVVAVDDALNATQAASEAARKSTVFWFTQQMSSRVNDPEKDAFVVMGQRLHEDDLAGHCRSTGKYECLTLPSEFDPARRCKTYVNGAEFFEDPRTEAGELLFPEMFPKTALEAAKKDLGSTGYAAQHEQLPMPAGGGLFKKDHWRFWRWDDTEPASTRRPEGCTGIPARILRKAGFRWDSLCASVDCTFKSAEASKTGHPDWVVITVWGCLGADRFLLWMWREQAGFNATCDAIREMRKRWPRCYRILVEDKANGSAVIETLQHEISGIHPVDPEGGKEARANAVQPQVESGNVYLPEGAGFLETWVGEFAGFPKGRHDDQVDSCTQALLFLHAPNFNATRAIATAKAVG